ncbi:peroxisomal membrane protein 11B-like [Eriocheir sinensis]|uniref:peroxisomal membrane protein 11B-like n=1 Tax=Eriocheir sinensis TaxID=95602 RepID=UPI0021C920E9|nr:peroxisomal membrane protein 11B-like [Eriocheir sinensis]XP_050697869.1 peroxisomal membrane protein 11B-like [Eriocheir sinensis]XP_050697870.1 peroxisomal membrane protein 11B-like [Eriocheir sinensis]XP_050697871.1 peroxisomal membrane protein 11B-like [Eriocheir sinensis]XP_050697872.1 peroxisomal membrane protein 11B-like [Eriocheir sinensis]XP_050697873.1 peroxisomal membrane protein 11B-like [Eriocheir sinensis]XP_050697874.1 peroxisomal membrane protein 11B-like [Eriocheir sinensi
MDVWVKLNASTTGKDKIFRLVQYLSRLVWHNLESRKNLRDTVARLKILESTFSTFRKLLRLGKSLEVLHGALRTLHLHDVVLRVTLTLSRIHQFLFLLADHIIWVGRAGLWDINRDKWTRISNKFWLGSIILNLLRDAYEVLVVMKRRMRYPASPVGPCVYEGAPVVKDVCRAVPVLRPVVAFAEEHRDVFWDCIKNLCDLWIPLANLGHAKLSPGTVGFLGSVSSMAGLVAVLDPLAKLAPA